MGPMSSLANQLRDNLKAVYYAILYIFSNKSLGTSVYNVHVLACFICAVACYM